ncbi:glycosyl hydrolase family 76-domain-containing protein [Astrocystis sublimbata]|nr:glycosyl hydrolase family 76-domain-containing protein [Astrocystis sublimbata]
MLGLWRKATTVAISLLLATKSIYAYDFDPDSTDSIKNVAKQLAEDLMSMYNGNEPGQTPGLLPHPYYWWEGGALMGALIDYWYYTGDTTYNAITEQGMLHQTGAYNDYMPANQTLTEGNDDQGFWAMAAMSAAEYNFQNPGHGQPQWPRIGPGSFQHASSAMGDEDLQRRSAVADLHVEPRLRLQELHLPACFFNIAARLALYTGNATYAEWAVKTWDWMFSYNVGAFLLGAAAMVEYSNKDGKDHDAALWHERVDGLLNSTANIFFFGDNDDDKVMIEVACESVNLCDTDQQSFKAYLSRWMAATTKWAPWTFDRVKKLLRNSAKAAVKQCTGGDNGRIGTAARASGQQMAAMEVVLANMIQQAKPPVTDVSGGTSPGDPTAGSQDRGHPDPLGRPLRPIKTGDRAGAAMVTLIVVMVMLAALMFMMMDESEEERKPRGRDGPGASVLPVSQSVQARGPASEVQGSNPPETISPSPEIKGQKSMTVHGIAAAIEANKSRAGCYAAAGHCIRNLTVPNLYRNHDKGNRGPEHRAPREPSGQPTLAQASV